MGLYIPSSPPANPEHIPQYLLQEFSKLSQALSSDFIQLNELNVEPKKKLKGMVVMADGTNWNPGSGQGVYVYTGAAWAFLG